MVTRRRFLVAAGACCGAALSGCGLRRGSVFVPPDTQVRRRRSLSPVVVARERVIRRDVGIRPFRRSGFHVGAELLGDKLLVHNYGHGGAGVTLSWGTAQLALEKVGESGRIGPVAVLGCGAVGLATARLLQDRGFDVTIYARELPPETTSNLAGASWYPSLVIDASLRTPKFDRQFERAARFSHRFFQGLVGERYGVCWREQFFLSDVPADEPWEYTLLRDLFPEGRSLARSEDPFSSPHVFVDTMMFIDPRVYLDALLRDFRLAEGRVQVRAFATPDELGQLHEPIIVNCTGLGARELFGDRDLVGIKGQLTVLVPQPEVDYAVATDEYLYMFPRRDGILLGGTQERGVETLEPNLAAERRILEGHMSIFDGMR